MLAVAAHTVRPGGTCATYSAAGSVRRALDAAGFEVERRPGYGRKRHMTAGRLP
jgi:tRNA U34 5-methylaminomethyl-2-thiouridine-forming methyltransferase MnmC